VNIGIIVFSQTGNTHSVALKLQEKLEKGGHSVKLEQIEISGELGPQATDFQLKTKPQVDAYDAVVFGAAVMAFSLSPAMKRYLTQISSLEGRKVACLVTQFFPFAWMGGNRAVRQMTKLCEAKGATVRGSGIVNWSRSRRDEQIAQVTDRLSGLF
jgi:flavodoxin